MNKKFTLILIILIVYHCFFMATVTVYAENNEGELINQNVIELLDELNLTELDEYLNENSNSILSNFGNSAKEIINYLINGNLNVNYGNFLSELINVIFKDATALLPIISQIIAIVILAAVVNSVNGSVISETTTKIVKLICYALILFTLSSLLTGIISNALKSIQLIKKQIEIIAPILITLTVLTGGSGSAAIYQPSAVFLSSAVVDIISGFVFPAIIGVIILNFMSQLNPELSFSGVSKLIKSIVKWVIGIVVAVFSIFLTVQSVTTSLFDGILFKATKYVVGSSVPIVGNFLSNGVDTFVSAGLLIKNSVGVCGLIILLSEIIQPVIVLVAFSLLLKFVGAISQAIGEKSSHDIFFNLSSDIEYLLAGILTIAFTYALIVMLIINSAVTFI